MNNIESSGIQVTSGFGARTNVPYVQILAHKEDWMTQIPAGDAIKLGLILIEAAEAALTDGMILNFARDKIGVSTEDAAQLLIEMREYREKNQPTPDK